MKIISLTAENVKKLSVVEITPQGNLVQITGKNGQGKSSVLDSISWALEGTEHIQAMPIRKGQKEGRIKLDLGEVIVRRTFKERTIETDGVERVDGYTTSVVVENTDGSRFPSPQKLLDSFLGALAFDPLAFAQMEPKEQFETLKRFVPGVDFDAIEKANTADYQARTDVNRRAKEARSQAAGISVPANTPAELVDEAALVASLEEAGRTNADIESRRGRRLAAEYKAGQHRDEMAKHQSRAAELRKQADDEDRLALMDEGSAMEIEAKLSAAPPLPAAVDTSAIRANIEMARQTNRAVADAKRKAEIETRAAALEGESKKLTKAMEKRETDKRAAIAAAKLPVAGIEFGDGTILMNGLPFDQASDAEKLRASVSIAMAMNPKLRVVRVRDGSLLDEDGLSLLAKMADEADCQVWLERVDSTGKVGFVLENGALKT
jgi:energy-coupling factor transporter ATP-binding protein EcfA2